MAITVKPLMFACPLFSKFCELNKGVNINTIPTLIGTVCCVGIVWFDYAKITVVKMFLLVKWSTFRAAQLKCFTAHLVKN